MACALHSQILNTLLAIAVLYTFWIFLFVFALHSRCTHWTHFHHAQKLNMHTLQTHKAPTHFCTERTLRMVFLHFSESCPGSVSCSISAMQDPLKLKSSGSRGTVPHGCGTGTVSVIKCIFFSNRLWKASFVERWREIDFLWSAIARSSWNLEVLPQETERRNDPFLIRITIVAPICVF